VSCVARQALAKGGAGSTSEASGCDPAAGCGVPQIAGFTGRSHPRRRGPGSALRRPAGRARESGFKDSCRLRYAVSPAVMAIQSFLSLVRARVPCRPHAVGRSLLQRAIGLRKRLRQRLGHRRTEALREALGDILFLRVVDNLLRLDEFARHPLQAA
jgi:hypothetical protein